MKTVGVGGDNVVEHTGQPAQPLLLHLECLDFRKQHGRHLPVGSRMQAEGTTQSLAPRTLELAEQGSEGFERHTLFAEHRYNPVHQPFHFSL